MKTDIIAVSGGMGQMEKVLEQADKVIAYKGLKGKDALHLRLLTEEMTGMMRSLTGESRGEFWIEDNENNEYQLHLKMNTRMTSVKREKLLAVSSKGRNEAARGLMGYIRDFFDQGTDEDLAGTFNPLMMPEMYEHASVPSLEWEWSMKAYREELYEHVRKDETGAKEVWDELEKSVVTHVADDIKVSIYRGEVEMIIVKKLAA